MTDRQRTALITGTSRGIGLSIAEKLLKLGWHVIGVSRSDVKLGKGYRHLPMDLQNIGALQRELPHWVKTLGNIDALVLNAGRGDFGGLEEFSWQGIDSLIHLNLLSPIYLTKAFLPEMKKRGSGDVLAIGSEAGVSGGKRGAVYAASKGGLYRFCKALRDECAKSGVRVSIVQPSFVRTGFYEGQSFSPGDDALNALEPETIAETVSLILNASPSAVFDEILVTPLKKVLKFASGTPKSASK